MEQSHMTSELTLLGQQRFSELFPERDTHEQVLRLLALSDFAYRILAQHPQWIEWLLDEEAMKSRDCEAIFTSTISDVSEQDAFRLLRIYRKRYWLKLMWLDLVLGNDIADSILYQSNLSEHLIASANEWAFSQVAASNGMPLDTDGQPISMLVLGMGKLGGRELNFSSDIDLIFTYPKALSTQGGRRSIEAQVFYTKVAQKLIAALDQRTVDGQVFRVDMRLRPFGDSGPLVMSFSAMEDYYQDQGREWERYAMLKARLLGKQNVYWDEFKALIRPFVFRRYIDFSVIESLRKMKHMIAQEVRRKGLRNNIKLGAGGIREVEFIVQALQMIRGGREPDLQIPSLLGALNALAKLEVIPKKVAQDLQVQYLFLRRAEQYLQAFNDEQTQTIPDDDLNQQRLCALLGVYDVEAMFSLFDEVQSGIRQEFAQVIGEEAPDFDELDPSYTSAWEHRDMSYLEIGLSQAECTQWQDVMNAFYTGINKKQIGVRGRDVLDRLMPLVLREMRDIKSAEILQSVLEIIAKIASRTAYLELLFENLGALQQLIKLCAHSSWIAQQIARYPILLDELIDPAVLYRPLPLNAYYSEIQQYFLRIDENDLELQMEALRQFKQTQQLRIAAADATGVLDIMKVSDHLTALAESIVSKAVDIAWAQMVARYGYPEGTCANAKGFAVIAYGKGGGFELGYDSDLDLVFVHNCDGSSKTVGDKSISSRQFYLKLAQRLMHLFNTRTPSGILYELDTRLRPEGNSGLLAINIESYYQYQQEQAWTWEHQALVRARMIVGEDELVKRFHAIRHDILCRQRHMDDLQGDIVKMRVKMRTHLSKDSEQEFDLKQGGGGMTDIEFLTQYIVLAFAHDYPALTRYSDNIRILEQASAESVISEREQSTLTRAYCQLREFYHLNSLNGKGKTIDAQTLLEQSTMVKSIWQAYLE
ncbi:bifunctional [glutamate--ammonia ligase]-adenylyl-L-tyrosine phosphorylase/[glutamate--ammonia-ligase] adenylyltransferase [Pseudoalteromonas luteoviolacea]|uniref:bifunctional [glutamate--ammonia ligase]-adenylyl-L-tyrosine phosphorylase/[glutamate--ammonia-ligase] adenylyltransferase n=1 Tax=Pseudoalteromonas luteoviolacea TaxID=43657 RepID=UPI001B36DEAE|nr:bifunctional [glutamate--ammonia ligase]-adenylyl-L-tyrosine phosphorylase/[glutamate--ammonia-ligase] adenylyltransferase [Pseudoalteromonas luteoviolacea]MBQ4813506.1 bifunctional [glutamate--ammonia ligase]-adenylyl-L-tyrosine phosphorylase/[glutamate--ammonia-ligase] adenylyltransferase [Pseudoalteromonas luteoviolacea]